MMGWYDDGLGPLGWVLMIMAMTGFWALVVLAVAAVFRGTRPSGARPSVSQRHPREILDERFARGEIDAEEYHARLAVLEAAR